MIDIGVDVTHPVPVVSTDFPAATIVISLAQHEEELRSIRDYLLEVPIPEELRVLRDRADITKAERATLHATIRTMKAADTRLLNRMRDEK
ncbi:hypothetical protein Tco_1528866 [Tanacetum coccineum]